jgi:SOUL heme-binding protein
VAEVETTGERDKAANAGFLILAGFIFGKNEVKQKIAMTTPVTQTSLPDTPTPKANMKIAMTTPVTQTPLEATTGKDASATEGGEAKEQRWRVTFTMPSEFTLETLPTPNDKRIRLLTEPGQKVATIRFSGFSTQANMNENRAKLELFVKERNLKTKGVYTVAFYDDPFTLPWNRRNEWWVPIE